MFVWRSDEAQFSGDKHKDRSSEKEWTIQKRERERTDNHCQTINVPHKRLHCQLLTCVTNYNEEGGGGMEIVKGAKGKWGWTAITRHPLEF
jgi:hypothetical protein